jgi:dipeptide transport system substrate-binding protein
MKLLISFILLTSLSVQAKTFIYCSEGGPSAFNPQITSDGTSSNAAAKTIYDRLVDFKYGSTEIVPSLAESWEISKDKKTYTFKLRKNVSFHQTKYFTPSRTLNADDVIFSFNRQRLKDHPFHKVGGGQYDYFIGMDMGNIIKDISKVDDYTVKITLTKPEAPFIANMAMAFMSILSKEYADQLTKTGKQLDIDHKPIGTGPFVYRKYVKDSMIRYRAHKNYWGAKPKIKNLVFAITTDPHVRYQKLKAGECHLIIEPAPADLALMKKDPNINVISGTGLNVGYLAMNTEKPPFNNLKVRQAINHALNKEAYIKAIYLGNAEAAKNPIPPSLWSYNNQISDYKYDVKKAKSLLAAAGFKNGFKAELWTLPVTRPYNPNGKKMGEMMQADLKKIGIDISIKTFDWPTYLKKSKQGEHQMVQFGWTGDNGDPDNFLHVLLGCTGVKAGSNFARWCDKSFNSLIEKAKTLPSQQERTTLYQKAQFIFKKQAPWVPLAHATIFRAMRKNVSGYKIDPLGHDIFREVELK